MKVKGYSMLLNKETDRTILHSLLEIHMYTQFMVKY